MFVAFLTGLALGAELHVPGQYSTIQSAIVAASDGDVVIVSPGTYTGSIDFLGKAITVRSTNPDDDVVRDSTVIRASEGKACVTFQGGETARCVLAGLTIFLGVINCTASSPIIERNKIGPYGASITCSQSSATIRNNLFIPYNSRQYTITCLDSAVTIEGNTIYGNKLAGYEQPGAIIIGGGVSGGTSVIAGNQIIGRGAKIASAIYLVPGEASAVIRGNLIADWTKGGWPGVVIASFESFSASSSGDLIIDGNVIADNTGMVAIYDESWANTAIIRNTISANAAGVILGSLADRPLVQGNTIIGNSLDGASSPHTIYPLVLSNTIAGNQRYGINVYRTLHGGVFADNLIVGNGGNWGCGVMFTDSSVLFAGNTVVGNKARSGGGGLQFLTGVSGATHPIRNCIVWGNRAPEGSSIAVGYARPEVSHCSVQGGLTGVAKEGTAEFTWGPGNIDADPLFVDPGRWDDPGTPTYQWDDSFILGDYHLLPGSPCIDGGTNDVDNPDTTEIETLPDTDIAGQPRVIDGNLDGAATVDIGAYEYLPGDVNYDGRVNVLDLILVRNSLGRDPASSIEARKADVNADGAVNVQDMIMVRGQLAK